MITLTVNGKAHQLEVDPETPLLYVLRGELALNSAKFGCGLGEAAQGPTAAAIRQCDRRCDRYAASGHTAHPAVTPRNAGVARAAAS